MQWTEDKLRALPSEKLRTVYEHAKAGSHTLAGATLALIEKIGIPPEKSTITFDSPLGKKLQSVIFSPAAKKAAIAAAVSGQPPMAVIDPMLQAEMGSDYRSDNDATVQAGYLVANMMRQNFWETNGKSAPLPGECVAKTAALFVHIPIKKTKN